MNSSAFILFTGFLSALRTKIKCNNYCNDLEDRLWIYNAFYGQICKNSHYNKSYEGFNIDKKSNVFNNFLYLHHTFQKRS